MNNSFIGKTIIITGAGGGIGRRIVMDLLPKNINLVATDINLDALRELLPNTSEIRKNIILLKHDVRIENEWFSILREIESKGWDLYGLINCAAVLKPGYIANIDSKEIDFHFDINTKGTILGSTIISQYLTKKGKIGHIINISSLAGVAPIPGIALYSASKFAVRGFSIALGYELKNKSIYVSVICPDAVNTPMLDLQIPYEEASMTFSGSTLEPADISRIVYSCLKNPSLEVTIPIHRGILAKIGNFFPSLAYFLVEPLKKVGRLKQNKWLFQKK